MHPANPIDPEQGIALTLATQRRQTIGDVRYALSFSIPEAVTEPIVGHAILSFSLRDSSQPLVLDFAHGADFVTAVSVNGKRAHSRVVNGHIVIAGDEVRGGENVVEMAFRAGDASLNRNADFLYTLFVPARAHLAFPCFDQPDLKARFTLELVIPSGWETVANGAELSREHLGGRTRFRYAETEPISTYLFAFAAGKFQVDTAERNGRTYRMFHRETDLQNAVRNRDAIFDLHAASLDWLERYTAIAYPFGKFDFVLIPSFQFSGMEHPGAIFYNAALMLLDQTATENQLLGRASLIAHETAHMWFGDLVTMRWFDDVWMKEVFANFLAAKIVDPLFPNVNHDLRFLLAHYPGAYAVDRTRGAHPIRQELTNLDDAGTLYGPIIYQKAPIVMRQLERILGAGRLQDGVRTYLQEFKFGNAAWPDLVRLLDEHADVDLREWSRAWVEEAGRPSIMTEFNASGRIAFIQSDPEPGRSLDWTQQLQAVVGTESRIFSVSLEIRDVRTELPGTVASSELQFVLPNGGGLAYGDFTLDNRSREFLLKNLPSLPDPLTRGAAWVTLWEELLDGRVHAPDFMDLALTALPREDTEQNTSLVLGYAAEAFWRFLSSSRRAEVAPRLEHTLQRALMDTPSSTFKSAYFAALRSTFTTSEAAGWIERVWRREERIAGCSLGESEEAATALQLAVRSVSRAAEILDTQKRRFTNADRKARFEFVAPAASESEDVRDELFKSLADVNNRRREPWALEGLRYLSHPLRAATSIKYIQPGLELLQEIQRTGDIFFPKNWMDALLSGHNTVAAAKIVQKFLDENPVYPPRLRRIILQSADPLFRAAGSKL